MKESEFRLSVRNQEKGLRNGSNLLLANSSDVTRPISKLMRPPAFLRGNQLWFEPAQVLIQRYLKSEVPICFTRAPFQSFSFEQPNRRGSNSAIWGIPEESTFVASHCSWQLDCHRISTANRCTANPFRLTAGYRVGIQNPKLIE